MIGPSPTPWRVDQTPRFGPDYPRIRDANGHNIIVSNDDTGRLRMEDAIRIVDAVNWLTPQEIEAAVSIRNERDGLRKQVAAYLLELVKRSSINDALGEALKRICEICGEAWDAPERDREAAMSKALNDIYELAKVSRKEAAK